MPRLAADRQKNVILRSSGDIFVIAPLDYELSHEFYITVEATDGGSPPLSDMATVNINVTDVNDNAPVFSQRIYAAVVGEDAELGKTVLTVRPASKNGRFPFQGRLTGNDAMYKYNQSF